ncbi:ATP-dependent RNA helicase TDRD9-like [Paramacrobiotus metropolitanus]|uniref:ATP-dependent RNA helicase TDRD9-like n=1 Tax=Paramacrobiotus metropolitanus TaxID=2943436 RepID=UPI0024460D01|nr:ATP-dependent RNA helicase TDRD9-like [Paramacrobiotus metropolitanus]XP_055337490.1 ATP-dependent RNA helicase TDRD9-like [Paramacrobiotus metropolitanus]XP_055337491.1 ATP-dependent RNA helicase TDRD9-like [Paramacrobiotus metropolitanus]XP_055337492.1 ATP-dependent RNA helicase TDRD9-like [Paramacrobiotus metropolitanus]
MNSNLGPPPATIKNEYDSISQGKGIQFDGRLPIAEYRQTILDTVRNSPVTLIHGATGCGKTTQIPQYILENFVRRGKMPYIVVTQPRRIAAVSIAQYVCQERGWTLGGLIGYQIAQESVQSAETRVVYCTLGVLLEKLVHNQGRLDYYTHVILDEVHEREEEMDLALLLMKRVLKDKNCRVRLIVMSATMHMEKLVAYLDNPPVIALNSGLFDVTVKYLDDIPFGGFRFGVFSLDDPYMQPVVTECLVNLVAYFDEAERGNRSTERGSVLIFAPGIKEIKSIMLLLEGESARRRAEWEIIPLHSTIANKDQRRIFQPKKASVRRIIVSTNIAESSITVPDVKYIVDLCLTKQLERRANTSFTGLNLTWASKSNCEQRRGRAGRVSSGICYRLVQREFYDTLPSHATPEMLRVPLHRTILRVKKLGIASTIYEILTGVIDAPNPNDIERNVLELMQAEALTVPDHPSHDKGEQRVDGQLTAFGHVMASLPLDIALSRLIILSVCFDCVEEGIIIAACLASRNFLDSGFGKENDKYKMKLEWDDGQCSDPLAALAAYRAWYDQKSTVFRSSIDEEREWCNKYSISWHRINEVSALVTDLENHVKEFSVGHSHSFRNRKASKWDTAGDQIDQRLLLQLVITGAFYPNFFHGTGDTKRVAAKGDAFLDELRCVQLYARVSDSSVISTNGVKAFFHKNIGVNPDNEIRIDEQGAITVFFSGDNPRQVPKAVYRSLKLRDNRDIQKCIEPPRPKLMLQPRSIRTDSAASSANATSKFEVVQFNGPASSLEIREFCGITKGTELKVTRMERSSVNSITLNNAPLQKMKRWIVAADVSSNSVENKLILENTTLLEGRPEFSALVFLLFTNAISLIPHKDNEANGKSNYIGIRGSLDRHRRLLRDNNFVMYFDTVIDEDMMVFVRIIRNSIRGCFGADVMKDPMTRQVKVPGYRKAIRHALHMLLNSDYEFVPCAKNSKYAAKRDQEVFFNDLHPFFSSPLNHV